MIPRSRRATIEALDIPEPVAPIARRCCREWPAPLRRAPTPDPRLPDGAPPPPNAPASRRSHIPERARAGRLAAKQEGSEPAVGHGHGPERRGPRRRTGGPVSLPASGWTQKTSERVRTSMGSQKPPFIFAGVPLIPG